MSTEVLRCVFCSMLLLTPTAVARGDEHPAEVKPTAECEKLRAEGLARGSDKGEVDYGTACCFASSGDKDAAFRYLQSAIQAGYHDARQLARDKDLTELHGDPRWHRVVELVEAAQQNYLKTINVELFNLFQEDQEDRLDGKLDAGALSERDRRRLAAVRRMLSNSALSAADDYYHAAMICQHGDDAEDYKLAKQLAEKAFHLSPSLIPAKWLSAAAQDRYLWKVGKPQWYGTQFHQDAQGRWTIEPIDVNAVTDAQRRELGVPTSAETKEMLDQMNKEGLNSVLQGNRGKQGHADGGNAHHL